jgi:hypothetical protein
MQIEQSEIKKYKIINWFDKKKLSVMYGIDVVMSDGKSYHCLRRLGKPLIYDKKADAIKDVKKLNKDLKDERSVATMPNK